MARPKKNSHITPARERIIDAFWKTLSEKPYSEISVKCISETAHVNKNTFYYHFSYIEDLAQTCIHNSLPFEIPKTFIEKGSADIEAAKVILEKHQKEFRQIQLACSPQGSGILSHYVRKQIIDYWLEAFSLTEQDLTSDEIIMIAFATGGITTVLGESYSRNITLDDITHYFDTPFAKGALTSIPKMLMKASQRSNIDSL